MVTHAPPTSDVCSSNPETYVGKVGGCLLMVGGLQNLDQLYVLVSSAHKTTHRDMTCIVLKVTLKPK